jgi:hypothetical protein
MTKRLVPWMSVVLGGRLFSIRWHARLWGHNELAEEVQQLEWRVVDVLAKGGKVQECECALANLCRRLDEQTLKLCKILVEVA